MLMEITMHQRCLPEAIKSSPLLKASRGLFARLSSRPAPRQPQIFSLPYGFFFRKQYC